MALICNRISLLDYSKLSQPISFSSLMVNFINRVAMGSPLGPLMVNVFMCYLEEKLTRDGLMPQLYKGYVDDTLARMPSADVAAEFLSTLNGLHPSLRALTICQNWPAGLVRP